MVELTGDIVKRHLEARQTAVQFAKKKSTLEQVKDYQGTILISMIEFGNANLSPFFVVLQQVLLASNY